MRVCLSILMLVLLFAVQVIVSADGYLTQAAKTGDAPLVRNWIALGHNVDEMGEDGRTPLVWAAYNGHTEVVRFLIEDRIDVNTTTPDMHGMTALQAAAAGGHANIAQILIDAGSDVNAQQDVNGATALLYATSSGQIEVVQVLIDAKAELNVKTLEGKTALTYAKESNQADIVKLLNDAGAKE